MVTAKSVLQTMASHKHGEVIHSRTIKAGVSISVTNWSIISYKIAKKKMEEMGIFAGIYETKNNNIRLHCIGPFDFYQPLLRVVK